jgi:plastocyanin
MSTSIKLIISALLLTSGAADSLRGHEAAKSMSEHEHMKKDAFPALTFDLVEAAPLAAPALVEEEEALDLEMNIDGERRLFPLLPGTKCPSGHKCRTRAAHTRAAPLMNALNKKFHMNLDLAETNALNNNLKTLVDSDDYCARRVAMTRAAGLAAGIALTVVGGPAYAAETKTVMMGTESGQLVFQPAKTKLCKGDSVSWVIVKGGPHNVVFDEDNIPGGTSQEALSMDGQLGEEGETFTKQFDVAGNYGYYCEPHRSAGMVGELVVA